MCSPWRIAFFGAAVVLLLLRTMTMHEAYETVEWHVLILLGALIPISHALHDTGGTELLAELAAAGGGAGLPGIWALAAGAGDHAWWSRRSCTTRRRC